MPSWGLGDRNGAISLKCVPIADRDNLAEAYCALAEIDGPTKQKLFIHASPLVAALQRHRNVVGAGIRPGGKPGTLRKAR